jgi:hypothetical protein
LAPAQISGIRQRFAAFAAAHAAVRGAFKAGLRTRDPAAYRALLDDFRRAGGIAYDPELEALPGRIDAHDPVAINTAIAFLDADPFAFRTGYYKARLLRRLKRAQLSDRQRAALRIVLRQVVDGRDRREFRLYGHLAVIIADAELRAALEHRRDDPDIPAAIKRRAGWMLTYLDQSGGTGKVNARTK